MGISPLRPSPASPANSVRPAVQAETASVPAAPQTPNVAEDVFLSGGPSTAPREDPEGEAFLLRQLRRAARAGAAEPPAARADFEPALAALHASNRERLQAEHAEKLWLKIDPALRQDREFQKRAVLASAEMLSQVDPELRSDKALVLQVVRRRGSALQFASEALRSDPEVVLAAVRSEGVALQHASADLKNDKALALEAVRDDGRAFLHVDPRLRLDRDILFEALRTMQDESGTSPANVPRDLLEDRAFRLALALENVFAEKTLYAEAPPDPAFDAEIAMAFPPFLDHVSNSYKEQMLCARPELLARHESVQRQLEQLGIEDPMRLRNARLLEEVLRNRLEPRPVSDQRPTAIVVFPKSDADIDGVFNEHNLAELAGHYRVMYYEAGSDEQFVQAVKDGSRDGAAALLVVGGHGTGTAVHLGRAWNQAEERDLDLSDEAQLRDARLQAALAPDASIVMMSCSTGAGEASANNPANLLARVFPGREVFAPTRPSMDKLKFDREGRFLDPGYTGGDELTYRARHPADT